MKCTVYGNGLPRGTQVKKGWEPLLHCIPFQPLLPYENQTKALVAN